ncbi:hypothetical protein [Mucilaginibacter sp.]|uniref:hypothetical protein n=1 Tax=Mucilaginibacter sp. TaxID=1882438 RepID=UPI0025F516CC|nr:hypothetical protein [Mucilaginibacter sp.]
MLRVFTFFILLLSFASCKLFHSKRIDSIKGGGSYIAKIDSNFQKSICSIHSTHSRGVIFPAEYAKQIFGRNGRGKNIAFFTPDSTLIKKVDKEINYQYCAANEKHWINLFWPENDTVKRVISEEQKRAISKISAKFCLNWQQNWIFYDRQYIGVITPTGERVILIQLIDFRKDPHKYKQIFTSSWISGWHGWFSSNIILVYFNVPTNSLTMDGDI